MAEKPVRRHYPRDHGGPVGHVDFGMVRFTVCRDGFVLKSSGKSGFTPFEQPGLFRTGDALARFSEIRRDHPEALFYDELETIQFQMRPRLDALVRAYSDVPPVEFVGIAKADGILIDAGRAAALISAHIEVYGNRIR